MLRERYSKIKMNKRKDKVENMQKKMERKTLVAVERERERERESHTLKTGRGITLIALIVTTIFSYDENVKSSNNKGFLLQTI